MPLPPAPCDYHSSTRRIRKTPVGNAVPGVPAAMFNHSANPPANPHKSPCRGRRPDAPAAAPCFVKRPANSHPLTRRARRPRRPGSNVHVSTKPPANSQPPPRREGACPFRRQQPRQAPPSGESANVSRIHRRAFHVVPCAARKGQALSLQGNICEFAEGGGIGKVLLPACRVGTPYNCACANSPGVESNMFTTAAGYDAGSEKTAQSGCVLRGRGCAVCVSG